ncbi:MAG: glycosyltransferase [Verrucomicrobiae bacterium]|nr:glycosyltransferase [Verrucomicrobiae bacterium]
MRIAMLTNSISPKAGGMYHCVRLLAKSLSQIRDVEVNVMAIKDEHIRSQNQEWIGIKTEVFEPIGPRAFNYSPRLKIALSKGSWDIFHVHGLWQYIGIAGRHKAVSARNALIITPQGMLDSWALKHSSWKKRLAGILYENRNLVHASCIHAVCESEYHSVREYGLSNPVCVIPNGVEIPLAQENRFEPRMRDETKKMLLFLGRLHPKKGLENILRAWSRVKKETKRLDDWVLGIAGWDQCGHEVELKKLSDEIGLAWTDVGEDDKNSNQTKHSYNHKSYATRIPEILFLGPAYEERKDALMRACSAFILPSYSEGMPVAVLEAWSYGKPVIMTPACNLPEGYAAGAAIKVEPEPVSIANGIKQILEMSDQELEQMGRRGRQLVEERFSWPKIAQQMKSVYDWLLGGGPPPDCVIKD